MKQTKRSWIGLLAALLISTGVFVACQKDATETPELTSNSTSISNIVPSLSCCVDDLTKSSTELYICEDMTITAQNDGTDIIVNIVRTGEGGNDHFTRVEYAIYPTGGTAPALTDDGSTGNRQEATIKVPLAQGWKCDDSYTIDLVIKGLGGLNMPSCSSVTPDEDVDNSGRGKLTISKTYKAKALCVTTGCSMSQGFWFSKPQTVWTGLNVTDKVSAEGSVTIGRHAYTREEGNAIFRMSCNSAGKLGFQQVATIYLSIARGTLNGVPEAIQADVTAVENFLAGKAKLTTANACSSTFANRTVQAAAGRIGNWIDANHCSE